MAHETKAHMHKGVQLPLVVFLGLSLLFAVLLAGFLHMDRQLQRAEAEQTLVEEARMFAREMDAVWGFMDHAQYTINNTSNGTYEFKGLHCAIVGKSVGAIFSKNNNYTIRYTNFNPRNSIDYPDDFEAEALAFFNNDASITEYYDIVEYEGTERFRYLQALDVDETCLECHGDPVGEIDKTGFPREGWTLDTVGGAISIVIPLDGVREVEQARLQRDTLAFLLFTGIIGLAVLAIMWLFIMNPLNRMKRAFNTIEEGQLGVSLEEKGSVREIRQLISEFNSMSGELQEMYESIEGQVRDRTLDLRQANEILERQRDDLSRLNEELAKETQFKTNLLSMVNHELRTPLTAIITLAQVSREAAAESDSDKQAWGEIENSSQILLSMINNMLDIARSDAGMVTATREVMDLGDIVLAVRQSLEPIAAKYAVDLQSHVASNVPLVMGDYEKTTRILTNLVSNAIKFTPDGGHVQMNVVYDENVHEVRCSVTDDGIGISPADQARIFERFVQVDSTPTRKYAGSGLGLAIVREYAELQGYTITLESTLGQGSNFSLIIPQVSIIEGEAHV